MGNLRHWVCGLVNSAMSMKGNLVEKFVPNKMAWDLVAGLNYLKNSEFAMVHGNLTPQNILIGEKGHLVIADPLIFKQFRMIVQKVPKKGSKVAKKDDKPKSRDKTAKNSSDNESESEKTEKKATLKSKKHIGECFNAKAWLAPELLKQFDKSSYAEETANFEGDVFSLGLILFYIYSYGEHPFAPEDSNFSSSEVRENIMNNNICLKTRFISEENVRRKSTVKQAEFQEFVSFENIDVEERITMPRDKVLPGFCVTLLKWMLEHDVAKRALIEEVVDEFNGINLIG
jgi:serine/threonine protein kinase